MKNFVDNLFVGIACLLFIACSDEEKMLGYEQLAITRAVNESYSSSLIDDWENQVKVRISSGEEVNLPWAPSASIDIGYYDFFNDIKKEDGWTMLFHTFDVASAFQQSDYMFFYNQFTGFVKVFYYYNMTNNSYSGALWKFAATGPTTLFNLNNYIALSNKDIESCNYVALSNAAGAPTNTFINGWNGFELEVPYSTDYKKLAFGLTSHDTMVTSYNFSGTTTEEITGTIIKTTQKEGILSKAISTIGGNAAKSWITKLKKKVDDKQEADTTGQVKAKLGTKIVKLLSQVSAGDFTSVISQGLKLIFGSSTVTEKQDVHLTSNGTLNMTGTSQAPSTPPIKIIGNLNFYDIMNPNPAIISEYATCGYVLPQNLNSESSEKYLGLWTLAQDPVIRTSRYSRVDALFVSGGCLQKAYLCSPYKVGILYDVMINPQVKPYLQSYRTSVELIACEKLNGQNYPNSFFSKSFNTDLIYEDKDMKLTEAPINYRTSENSSYGLNGLRAPDKYDYYWDWKRMYPKEGIDSNILAVISVCFTFNINGKETTVTSSRTYKADLIYDDSCDEQILKSGRYRKAYIVNTNTYHDF